MNKKMALILIGIFVGLLIVLQFRSYDNVQTLFERDTNEQDVVNTIYALKMANESLKEDILELESQLEQYSDQKQSHKILVAEIEKNELLLGLKPILGPGLQITTQRLMSVEEMVDFINSWWAVGAEAISINGFRITESSQGFSNLNELLLFSGNIIEAPVVFEIIGDTDVLETRLLQLNLEEFSGAKLENIKMF